MSKTMLVNFVLMALPLAVLRFVRTWKQPWRIFEDCVALTLPLVISPWLIIPWHLVVFIDTYLFRVSGLRFEWDFLHGIKDLKTVKEGIGRFPWHWVALLVIWDGAVLGFSDPKAISPLWLFAFILVRDVDHVWLLWFKRLFFKKKGSLEGAKHFRPENEVYRLVDPEYPLLKETVGFFGDKHVDFELKDQPNVVFINLESASSSQIFSPWNPMPFFKRLCEENIFFDQFYSVSTRSMPAIVASFFGIPGHPEWAWADEWQCRSMVGLPQIFKKAGYELAYFHNGRLDFEQKDEFLTTHGFDPLIGSTELCQEFEIEMENRWGVADHVVFNSAKAYLKKQTKPVFLNISTVSTHFPWQCPKDFIPPPFETALHDDHRRYLQTLKFADTALEAFFKDDFGNTVFVLFGDHGQGMGEHSEHYLGKYDLFEENIKVPLCLYAPKKTYAPKTIHDVGSQVDLVPTIMDMLGLKGLNHSIGSSLVRKGRQKCAYAYLPYNSKVVAKREGNKKWVMGTKTVLYDLKSDSEEKNPEPVSHLPTLKQFFELIRGLYHQNRFAPKRGELSFYICPKISMAEVLKELEKFKTLVKIDLTNATDLCDEHIEKISKRFPNLYGLRLQNSPFLTDRALQALQTHLPRLRFFCLSDANITTEGMQQFLKSMGHLESLSLGYMPQLEDGAFKTIKATRALRTLRLWGLGLTDQALTHLSVIKNQLIDLKLDCIQMEPEAVAHFVSRFKELVRVEFIGASDFDDTDFINALKHHEFLSTLVIQDGFRVTDEFLNAINGSKLSFLVLTGALITDNGLKKLNLKCLNSLILRSCPLLTKEGLDYVKVLPSLCTIEYQNQVLTRN